MAIVTTFTNSFAQELPQAEHDFSVSGDNFYWSLYTGTAELNAATPTYTPNGESSGAGYMSGGQLAVNLGSQFSGGVTFWGFLSPIVWTNTTLSADGAMAYNKTNSNKSVSIHDFGNTFITQNGDFSLIMPSHDAGQALYRFQIL